MIWNTPKLRKFLTSSKDYPVSPVGYGMTAIRAWHELLFTSRNLAIFKYGIPTPFDNVEVDSKRSISAKEKEFLDANKALQDICDKLLKKDPRDPLALYFKGVSYENLSTQALTLDRRWSRSRSYCPRRGKFSYTGAEIECKLVDANQLLVPEYVVGSLPFFVRWTPCL
jgi:hypothetical protein